MAHDVMAPHPSKPRHPTDTKQMHGQVLNAPRMMQIGGADSLHKKNGPFKNSLGLRKVLSVK